MSQDAEVYQSEGSVWSDLKREDKKAQKEIFIKYFNQLISVAKRYVDSLETAEDVVMIAFQKFFSQASKYAEQGKIESYLKTIVIRTAINQYKSEIRFSEKHTKNLPTKMMTPINNSGLIKMKVDDILNLIDELPKYQNLCFNLHVIDGYRMKEISESYNIPLGSVKYYVHQARKELNHKLNKLGYHE